MNTRSKSSLPAKKAKKTAATVQPVQVKEVLRQDNSSDLSFIREVDDAMHEERLRTFWQSHRWSIIGILVALLAGTAGWQGWQSFRHHHQLSVAADYYAWSKIADATLRAKNLPGLVERSEGGYRALAAFTEAREKAKTDPKAADRIYGKIYNNGSHPQWLRDIARLNAALVLLGREDTLAQEHLTTLAQAPEPAKAGPAYPIALELLAVQAQRQGDTTTARGYTERLLSLPDLTPDLRQRAQRRLGALSTLAR